MQPARPRPRRYPFTAEVELTHLQSAARLKQFTSDLSEFGCHVSTDHMWPVGSEVRVRIEESEKTFSALARVVYDRPMVGMGLAFVSIDPKDQSVLDQWIAGLRRAIQKAPREPNSPAG
jgi:hypothetical protein